MGSRFPYDKDNRSHAKVIAALDRPSPTEVVIINEIPLRDLNLYLNCEVERAVASFEIKIPLYETLAGKFKERAWSTPSCGKRREAKVLR